MRRVLTRDQLNRLFARRRLRTGLIVVVVAALAAAVVAIVSISQPATAAVSAGVTERVSVATNGTQANHGSFDPQVSADGRYVAFVTNAALDPLDGQNDGSFSDEDVYVRDTVTHTTTLVSRGQEIEQPSPTPSPSPTDGGPIIFAAPFAVGDIHDVPANGASFDPSISATGRYIAFTTQATNIPANSTNSNRTVICDRDPDNNGVFGACTYTTVGNPGAFLGQPVISGDGTRLAFIKTFQTVEWVDLPHGANGTIQPTTDADFHVATLPASVTSAGVQYDLGFAQHLAISADGAFLAIIQDYRQHGSTTGFPRITAVLAYRVATDTAVRMDLGDNLAPLASLTHDFESVSISGNGHRLAFDDLTTTEPRSVVHVVDRDPDGDGVLGPATGQSVRSTTVSRNNSGAIVGGAEPALSADGRYVAFETDAGNVHNGVDDLIRDFSCIHQVPGDSVGGFGSQGSGSQGSGGRVRALASGAPTGISFCDVVIRNIDVDNARAAAGLPRLPAELGSPSIHTTCLAFVPGATCEGDQESFGPALVADGSAVAYMSDANDLVNGDTNNSTDIFLRRYAPGLSVPNVDFGSVPVGDDTTLAVPVSHVGFGPLRVGTVAIGGANASEFTVFPAENCTGALLFEAQTCTVSVRFRPTAEGARNATLTVTTAAGVPVVGKLVGTGGPRRTPNFKAQPDPLDFGPNLLFTPTAARTVTVTNTGTANLTISAVALTGTAPTGFPGDYTVNAANCLAAPIAPAATCQVSVVFNPQAVGNRPALLQFTDNAAALPQVVALTGSGIQPVLKANPPLAPPGAVSQVSGTGFPANRSIVLTLDLMPGQVTVTSAADGTFAVPFVIFPHTQYGKRQLHALVQGVPGPLIISTDFLVVPGSLQPPDFAERR